MLKWAFSLVSQSGPPAAGLRKPESPKSAGESAGNSAGKKGTAGSSAVSLFFQRKRPPGTAPSSATSSPLFPGTVPGTLPSTFGGFGLYQSCSRRPRSTLVFFQGFMLSAGQVLIGENRTTKQRKNRAKPEVQILIFFCKYFAATAICTLRAQSARKQRPPQGPCRIKSTTVIVLHYSGAKQYDGSKTLRQGL